MTKTFKQYLIEEGQEYDLFVGRFQPFHKGHASIIESMKNPIIAVVKGKNSSEDKVNNPLSFKQQKSLIHEVFPSAIVIEVMNANLNGMLFHLKNEGKQIRAIYAGEDRIKRYREIVEESNKKTGLNIQVKQTPRITSATDVREAIRTNNFEEYIQLMPMQLANEDTFMKLQSSMLIEQRNSEYRAWSDMNDRVTLRRKESREEVEQRVIKQMQDSRRAAEQERLKKELEVHKTALSKTKPGTPAHEIIKKKIAQHEQKMNS
jgi:nicotinamide mononucleotide adenylyltransferase